MVELCNVVSIGRNYPQHISAVPRPSQPVRWNVEPVKRAVDLESGPGCSGSIENRIEIELNPRATSNPAPCEMPDGIDGGVSNGTEEPIGLLGRLQIEVRVHRRHAPAENLKELRVVIH